MSGEVKKRITGRGAILLLVGLLVGSAGLRLVAGTGPAIAQAVTSPPTETAMADKEAPEAMMADALDRNEVNGLLAALRERESRIREMETQIEVRRKALDVANAEISRRMAALEQTEANLRRTLSLADGAAEDDLTRLTAVYENMKPKEAAELFETMEPDFAAGFLGRMRPDAAASIMAGLTPDAAYSISVILAGRNARAPKS